MNKLSDIGPLDFPRNLVLLFKAKDRGIVEFSGTSQIGIKGRGAEGVFPEKIDYSLRFFESLRGPYFSDRPGIEPWRGSSLRPGSGHASASPRGDSQRTGISLSDHSQ